MQLYEDLDVVRGLHFHCNLSLFFEKQIHDVFSILIFNQPNFLDNFSLCLYIYER